VTAREPAIAEAAADWLESLGLDVYEEVHLGYGARVPDLVGSGSESLVVVECKCRLGLDLIEQADYWRRHSNAYWAAFMRSEPKRGFRNEPRTRWLAEWICVERGIGILEIDLNEGTEPRIVVPAIVHETPRAAYRLRDALRPENRRGAGPAAGTNRGGYTTTFRRTAERVVAIVTAHPDGIDVKSIVAELNADGGHHYSNDRSAENQIRILVKRGIPVFRGIKIAKVFGRHSTVLRPAGDP